LVTERACDLGTREVLESMRTVLERGIREMRDGNGSSFGRDVPLPSRLAPVEPDVDTAYGVVLRILRAQRGIYVSADILTRALREARYGVGYRPTSVVKRLRETFFQPIETAPRESQFKGYRLS
jgi:hypothetical protein